MFKTCSSDPLSHAKLDFTRGKCGLNVAKNKTSENFCDFRTCISTAKSSEIPNLPKIDQVTLIYFSDIALLRSEDKLHYFKPPLLLKTNQYQVLSP